MNPTISACSGWLSIGLLSIVACLPTVSSAAEVGASGEAQYLRVSVDNLVIDTDGLVAVSNQLAQSIDRLGDAIDGLSNSDAVLTSKDNAILLSAVRSVDQASVALAQLATDLPRTAQTMTEQLPRLINEARAPIAELSSGLQKASDGIVTLTESLPQATENAKSLVDSVLDSMLLRLTIFIVVLFAALAAATLWIVRGLYTSYLDPLAKKLDALVGAPEHFASLAQSMKDTSQNMLELERLSESGRPGARGLPVYGRRLR